MKAHVYGDIAYTTCLLPWLQPSAIACTNVLRRIDGTWKVIHHHADKAPKMAATAEQFIRAG
jgi:hypothetical protein